MCFNGECIKFGVFHWGVCIIFSLFFNQECVLSLVWCVSMGSVYYLQFVFQSGVCIIFSLVCVSIQNKCL